VDLSSGRVKGFKIIADQRLENANGLISGANKNDYHFSNIDLSRDAAIQGITICGLLKQANLARNAANL